MVAHMDMYEPDALRERAVWWRQHADRASADHIWDVRITMAASLEAEADRREVTLLKHKAPAHVGRRSGEVHQGPWKLTRLPDRQPRGARETPLPERRAVYG